MLCRLKRLLHVCCRGVITRTSSRDGMNTTSRGDRVSKECLIHRRGVTIITKSRECMFVADGSQQQQRAKNSCSLWMM